MPKPSGRPSEGQQEGEAPVAFQRRRLPWDAPLRDGRYAEGLRDDAAAWLDRLERDGGCYVDGA